MREREKREVDFWNGEKGKKGVEGGRRMRGNKGGGKR